MLAYSEATANLIERQCRNVERKSFRLQKDKASEAILKTYDLFGLPRPKSIVWSNDIFNDSFVKSARSAWSAWSAWSARSAWSASSARSAWSASSARSAWSAWSASSASSASSARSALQYFVNDYLEWTALDIDFEYYIFSFEYSQNPDSNFLPNEDDKKYLDYCELLMQAKELGAGYRVEWENTLYIIPTPLVLIDAQNRFHSETAPAIRWKYGQELYYLKGENFDKELWQKIVSREITADEVLNISDTDKREIAFSLLGPLEMLKGLKAKLTHTGVKGNRLYECKNFRGTSNTEYALVMQDASTERQFIKFVPPEVGKQKDADFATAEGYKDGEGHSLPLEDYLGIPAMNEA